MSIKVVDYAPKNFDILPNPIYKCGWVFIKNHKVGEAVKWYPFKVEFKVSSTVAGRTRTCSMIVFGMATGDCESEEDIPFDKMWEVVESRWLPAYYPNLTHSIGENTWINGWTWDEEPKFVALDEEFAAFTKWYNEFTKKNYIPKITY